MSTKSVRRLIDSGDLVAVDISPSGSTKRTLRIDERTVDAFLLGRSVEVATRSKFAELEFLRTLEVTP